MHGCQRTPGALSWRTAEKASWGMSTLPTRFMRRLPAFLGFEQFFLAGDVAAVALGEDVLAERTDGFAGDDAGADGGLDGDFEELARDFAADA